MTRIGLVGVVRRIALTALVAGLIALATIDPFTLLNVAAPAGIGAYLVDRRPRNPIGWLLLAISVLGLGTTGRPDHDVAALASGTAPWNDFLWVWFGAWAGSVGFVCYAALAFVFPTGSLSTGPWGAVGRIALALAAALAFVPAIGPSIEVAVNAEIGSIWVPNVLSPLGADASFRPPPIGVLIVTLIPLSVMALGAADLLRRYRRGSAIERLQIRWLMASIAALVLAIVFGLTVFVLAGPEYAWIGWLPAVLAGPTLAPAIGIAVLRYRLYEIDRIISRTLSWAILTAVLVAIFAAFVVGLQAVLSDMTQGQTLAVAASTLIAFALFQPVRQRVQRAVDRRFDRARYDSEQTAAAFAERLRIEVDLDAVASDLTGSVEHVLRPRSLGLWLKAPDR
jgi:hypothetical protein